MTAPFSVECTQCSASLRVRNPELIGRKVRCPKCQTSFVVQEPDDPDDADSFYEQYDELSSDEFVDFGARRKKTKTKKSSSNQKSKQGRKRKSGKSYNLLLGTFAAGFVLLSLLGVGIYFALPYLFGGWGNRFAWLPNDLATYVEIRPADIWKANVMRPIRQTKVGVLVKDKLTEKLKIELEDIEKIVVGQSASQKEPMVIVHARNAIDPAVLEQFGEQSSYAGKTIYDDGKAAWLQVSDKMLVAGTREAIESAIDRNGECLAAERFAFVPSYGDLIVATISGDAAFSDIGLPSFEESSIDPDAIESSAFVMNFSNNLAMSFERNFIDSEQASAAAAEAQENLDEFHALLDAQQAEIEEHPFIMTVAPRAMMNKLRDMLKSVRISSWGHQFSGKMQISGQMVRDFSEAFEIMAPAFVNRFGDILGEEELIDEDDVAPMFPFGL